MWLSHIEDNGKKELSSKIYEIRIFGARNGNYERNAVVKNPGTKQRRQRILGDCWQWKTNGQCSKGDNCSFRHVINKRAKSTQPNPSPSSSSRQNERNASRTRGPRGKSPSGRMSRWPCKDYFKGTCTNSFCRKWHPPECLFYKTKRGCKCGEKCSYAHRQVDEQPCKRSKTNDDKSAVAMLKKNDLHESIRQLVCLPWQKSRQTGETRCQAWYLSWVETRTFWTSIIECTTIGLCLSRHEAAEVFVDFCGRAQTYWGQSNVWNSLKLLHVTLKIETKILRDEGFGDHETSESRASRMWQAVVFAYTARQLYVTCSSGSSEDFCGSATCTWNALNDARTSNKEEYYVKSFDERDDEAKAPTRQITGHNDLLASRDAHIQVMRKSIPELDESVTNAIEIWQMQQAEFVAAVQNIKGSLQVRTDLVVLDGDGSRGVTSVRSHVRAGWWSWRGDRSVSSWVRDECQPWGERRCYSSWSGSTFWSQQGRVRGGAHCWRRRRNVGSSVLQDIMTKYNEVKCVDKKTWCGTPISSRRWSSRTWLVRLHRARTVARRATNLEELTLSNLPEREDVQWMKHMLPGWVQAESWTKTVPRRRSPHRAVTASDLHLRVMTPLALRSSSVAAGGVEMDSRPKFWRTRTCCTSWVRTRRVSRLWRTRANVAPVGLSVRLAHWRESSQWVMDGLRRCLSSRSLIATHGFGARWIVEAAQLAVQ